MHLLRLFLVAQSTLAAIVAERQNSPACDEKCMKAFKAALAGERSLWATPDFKDDSFYTTPDNASNAKPGDLLRWEDISASQVGQNWTGIPGGKKIYCFPALEAIP